VPLAGADGLSLGVAGISDGPGSPEPVADGVGAGAGGAVGVGTGGVRQSQSPPGGVLGRAGPVRRGPGRAGGGSAAGSVGVRAGTATAVVPVVPVARGAGPPPRPLFEAASPVSAGGGAAAASGYAPAPAGRCGAAAPSPLTTAKQVPAAPTTASTPSAATAATRRGGRAYPSWPVRRSAAGTPPKVLIPVDVTSGAAGTAADGTAAADDRGRRPMS
jgi:hypothetical protein